MIYRVDSFTENNINPITNCEYDSTWLVFALSSDMDTPMIVGTNNAFVSLPPCFGLGGISEFDLCLFI